MKINFPSTGRNYYLHNYRGLSAARNSFSNIISLIFCFRSTSLFLERTFAKSIKSKSIKLIYIVNFCCSNKIFLLFCLLFPKFCSKNNHFDKKTFIQSPNIKTGSMYLLFNLFRCNMTKQAFNAPIWHHCNRRCYRKENFQQVNFTPHSCYFYW